jgi:hypothetical protein
LRCLSEDVSSVKMTVDSSEQTCSVTTHLKHCVVLVIDWWTLCRDAVVHVLSCWNLSRLAEVKLALEWCSMLRELLSWVVTGLSWGCKVLVGSLVTPWEESMVVTSSHGIGKLIVTFSTHTNVAHTWYTTTSNSSVFIWITVELLVIWSHFLKLG